MINRRIALLVLFFVAFTIYDKAKAQDPRTFGDLTHCYDALIGNRNGANLSENEEPFILLSASRDTLLGFYLYETNKSYFHGLSPQPSSSGTSNYHFRLQYPSIPMIYISYFHESTSAHDPDMMYTRGLPKKSEWMGGVNWTKTTILRGHEVSDEKSRVALANEIRNRIPTVAQTFKRTIDLVRSEHLPLRIIEEERKRTNEALDICAEIEEADIVTLVQREKTALQKQE